MAYEFKKLSDVTLVTKPTDIANVLIEENGVIKKAPKTAVGGAENKEADLIISDSYFLGNHRIEKGNFNDIVNKCLNRESVTVIIRFDEFQQESFFAPSQEIKGNIFIAMNEGTPSQIIVTALYTNIDDGNFETLTYLIYSDGNINNPNLTAPSTPQ